MNPSAEKPAPNHHGRGATPWQSRNPTRRSDGQIPALVLRHLQTNPQTDFSPYELARALRISHGTIRRHLLRLAADGQVRRTGLTPARFQAI